jgi:uncharacterized protein YdeI (YjbR/CyaY-like superfamily)
VWLALAKKGGTLTTLTWQQAVDEALCVGWIDGQARKRTDQVQPLCAHQPGWLLKQPATRERKIGEFVAMIACH